MDDLWKGDAATVYLHRNRGGGLYAAEVADGQTIRPVIDRTYPLERVEDAHRYVETDHKRGNVVVTVA